ncbi:MAG: 30S ribosomal protein S4 [Candidatus Omnitrophica bacterium]|nr:30S ribosomal protein S4 [Candidatus Omnitrophota bacterium]
MARYTGPSCRLCRREGIKLFLKGKRCSSEKCSFVKRQYAPGQHGQKRAKLSNYAGQLREKQKVKRIYGILEKQFRTYFQKAAKTKGVTGKMLLQYLERRLDNVIFHLHFATSRSEARQFVRHNHVYVNNRKVNIPSYLVKKDDAIELKAKEKFRKRIQDNIEISKERGMPSWLESDLNNLKGKIVRLPDREDIQLPISEQLIVELYSK